MAIRALSLFRGTLRTKFLLSLTLISALLTSGVLLVVQYRVRIHAREEIAQALRDSVITFQSLQQQRESTLGRTAGLLATLPPLKAVMTSADPATIQDASKMFWELAGSQVFALADRSGRIVALHSATPDLTASAAQEAMGRTLARHESRDWWFGGGHLFQVFLEPISIGAAESGQVIGVLAVGYEIDAAVAADVTRVASSQVGFGYERHLVMSSVPAPQRTALARHVVSTPPGNGRLDQVQLGPEQFLATSVRLSSDNAPLVTLTLLKSFDQATAFLQSLDRWILAIGITGICAGAGLVFLVSTTFTRPLGRLVLGVRALEQGDFAYSLDLRGSDEVATLTAAFQSMRSTLQDTQRQLLDAEQLATIGQLAGTISHDLRHPLTAILAYAEFLSERDLTPEQRKDFFEEIRIGVNRMMDEINSMLGFSKEREAPHIEYGRFDTVIDRAIKAVKVLPEFERTVIAFAHPGGCVGWFDAGKLERVMLNLLFNAAEAAPADTGRVEVTCLTGATGTEIHVADNGSGIPRSIADSLFRPFVSHGKEKGIGLGLTIVRNIMKQHDGEVSIVSTGPGGTVVRLFFPARGAAADSDAAASAHP